MNGKPPLTFNEIIEFVWQHWYVIGLHLAVVSQWVGSWLISAMDMPTTADSRNYRFWFRTWNYIAGNKARAAAAADPAPGDTVSIEKKKTTIETKVTETIVPPDPAKDK